jgi:hypothetical protein
MQQMVPLAGRINGRLSASQFLLNPSHEVGRDGDSPQLVPQLLQDRLFRTEMAGTGRADLEMMPDLAHLLLVQLSVEVILEAGNCILAGQGINHLSSRRLPA